MKYLYVIDVVFFSYASDFITHLLISEPNCFTMVPTIQGLIRYERIIYLASVVDPDPHYFGNRDPDPHQGNKPYSHPDPQKLFRAKKLIFCKIKKI